MERRSSRRVFSPRLFVGRSLGQKYICITCKRSIGYARLTHTHTINGIDICTRDHRTGLYVILADEFTRCFLCRCCFEELLAESTTWPLSMNVRIDYIGCVIQLLYQSIMHERENAPLSVCAICLDTYLFENTLVLFPCLHTFCSREHCRTLLTTRTTCPLCRTHLVYYVGN